MAKKEKTALVRISGSTHAKAKTHTGKKIKLGAFSDEAILEKIEKEKQSKSRKDGE